MRSQSSYSRRFLIDLPCLRASFLQGLCLMPVSEYEYCWLLVLGEVTEFTSGSGGDFYRGRFLPSICNGETRLF